MNWAEGIAPAVFANVVEQIPADDERHERSEQRAAGFAMTARSPSARDVSAPEGAQHPQACEGKGAMRHQPPVFQRMSGNTEIRLAPEPKMENEPQNTGEPNPDAGRVQESKGVFRSAQAPRSADFRQLRTSRRASHGTGRGR